MQCVRRSAVLAVVALCILVLAGCEQSADERNARQTVTRFYEALKDHDATTACALVSPSIAEEMLRASRETGKGCVPGLRHLFSVVSRSSDPRYFEKTVPHVGIAFVHGDHAT